MELDHETLKAFVEGPRRRGATPPQPEPSRFPARRRCLRRLAGPGVVPMPGVAGGGNDATGACSGPHGVHGVSQWRVAATLVADGRAGSRLRTEPHDAATR